MHNQMLWTYNKVNEQNVDTLKNTLNVSTITAEFLVKAGLTCPKKANSFLNPKLAQLENPFLINNLKQAVDRICQALEHKESVLIIGDYDVDGVTSTTLLATILRKLNLTPNYLVPRRLEEGYGLTHSIIERGLKKFKPSLLIALDCGTNSIEEVQFLKNKGIDTIIIDHHRSKEGVPENCILVNPHVYDESNNVWGNLCTVGLVFKLVHGIIKKLRKEKNEIALNTKLSNYLDLVAIGTIADMVPLLEENRIFTKIGLSRLTKTQNQGILALMDTCGISSSNDIFPSDISFKMGPRINASGRLADATLPVSMLLESSYKNCKAIALQLNEINRERQDIEKSIADEAKIIVEAHQIKHSGLVIYNENWHAGVVGIVAGRLSKEYNRPCIVLGSEGSLAKGSARSVPGVNLVEVFNDCKEYLVNWGGHPMAAGVALHPQYINDFTTAFNQAIKTHIGKEIPEVIIEINAWLKLNDLNDSLLQELSNLMPFGQGNPEPIFGIKNIIIHSPHEFFGDGHYRFKIKPTGAPLLFGVAWKQQDNVMPINKQIDLAIKIKKNIWNAKEYLQLELVDWRYPIND